MPGVTLASQFSVNRLTRFEDALAAWPGPVSAVVYLMDMSDIDVLIEYFRVAANLERYHRVELAVVAPNFADEERYRYPINQLRNIAIGMIRTTHHLLIDADFVPNRALYTEVVEKRFAEMWRTDSESSIGTVAAPNPSRTAFVVPCVALVEDYSGAYPETIDELRSLFDRRLAYITDSNAGHGLTADKVFLRSAMIKSSPWYEVCYESQWEPYYILPRTAPAWDERFRNQGGDKQQHALILNALHYRFLVLSDVYLYHRDHAKLVWPGGGLVRHENTFNYFKGWMDDMVRDFGVSFRWPHGCATPLVSEQLRLMEGIGFG
ncbi:glycosyl-transferase for dystroglycan-domain-containing protein [Thamnocephalis sphaerospora]|uniref:Glycosyl-transferase for dystroglycan-domain-containing protein n=1 Tax=Thamnocephalis sphaerospora TaxID=78915 RepID=A0A4V1IWA0_9FUNG|nr:glycosyl-transferase for dystroglycan-domain-containing protein [Thamnocephalis sphaerospora]|eukprot:RKP06829.1 glycosyl-transferase for dystroglycan-domain-containing protein [Thamnocephalis sphaerospora]